MSFFFASQLTMPFVEQRETHHPQKPIGNKQNANNLIAITATNDGSRVIMWGDDNLQVPSTATNVESATGFIFGDNNDYYFVLARRFDGSYLVWGNRESAITNVPGITNITRIAFLGTNSTAATPSEIRRYPYGVAETGDGLVAIWGGRLPGQGTDNYLGYLTNMATSISGVSRLSIHYYTFTPAAFYPILIAERGANSPVVFANSSLTNVPSSATNLVRITLTGGTNNGSDNIPRFLVGETSDKRVVIWSNGYGGGPGNANLGGIPLLQNVKKFRLCGSNGSAPVACVLLENNTMRTSGKNCRTASAVRK